MNEEKKTKQVTVIIPTYNNENTILRAIDSVLNQTYENIEILVIDDGSNDDTGQIVESINDQRVKYIYQEHANGNIARNKGITLSSGEYITFLDSDDEFEKNKIERQLSVLKKFNADICICGFENIIPNGEKTLPRRFAYTEQCIVNPKKLPHMYITTPCILFKKCSVNCLFDEQLLRWQDWDWLLRANNESKICYTPESLVNVHITSNSVSRKNNLKRDLECIHYLYNKKELRNFSNRSELLLRLFISIKKQIISNMKIRSGDLSS